MKKCKAVLSLLCSLVLLCSLFSMSVSAAEPEIEWLMPPRIKIGFSAANDLPDSCLIARGKNLAYQVPEDDYDVGNIFIDEGVFVPAKNIPDSEYWTIRPHALGWDYSVYPDGTGELRWAGTVCKPGTYTIQAFVKNYDDVSQEFKIIQKVGNPYTVIIEEPVITSNAPQNVSIGDELSFSAELTNTALSNKKVSYYENPAKDYHDVAYQPAIEIIEGENLVKVSGLDCSTILNAKANLTFLKAGTIKIKVKYNQISTCLGGDGDPEIYGFYSYSPEKTFTIQVKGGSTSSTESASTTPTKDSSSTTQSTDTSVTNEIKPTTTTTENSSRPSLVDTDTSIAITGNIPENTSLNVKTISTNDDACKNIQEKLPKQVSRFQTYDINLLDTDNAKVQPNGQVQISIPKPDGFGDNLAVYRTEDDGSMTLLDSAITDGKVIFTTDHFSLYTIAEVEDVPAIVPPSGGIPTGGIVAIVIGALVVVAGGVTAGILLYKKKKSAPADPA